MASESVTVEQAWDAYNIERESHPARFAATELSWQEHVEAAIRAEAVAEWREAVREDTPVEWGCSHCGMTRSVVIRFDEDGLAPASLNPPCPGYITCEAGGFSHPDDNSCAGPDGAIAWCPFDAADEYGTGDLEAVMAVRRERARLRALLEASQEEEG